MKLNDHLAASSAAGVGIWAVTGRVEAIPIAIAAGVLPDGDHLFDYFFWYIRHDFRKLVLLLHGWEWLVLAALLNIFVWREAWMTAVTLGYATQIGGDQIFNDVYRHTYFFLARARYRFEGKKVVPGGVSQTAFSSLVQSVPFGKKLLQRWFMKRMAPDAGQH